MCLPLAQVHSLRSVAIRGHGPLFFWHDRSEPGASLASTADARHSPPGCDNDDGWAVVLPYISVWVPCALLLCVYGALTVRKPFRRRTTLAL